MTKPIKRNNTGKTLKPADFAEIKKLTSIVGRNGKSALSFAKVSEIVGWSNVTVGRVARMKDHKEYQEYMRRTNKTGQYAVPKTPGDFKTVEPEEGGDSAAPIKVPTAPEDKLQVIIDQNALILEALAVIDENVTDIQSKMISDKKRSIFGGTK